MEALIQKIIHIWVAGGWTMIPLLLVSLYIYGLGASMLAYFSRRGHSRITEKQWRQWVIDPAKAEGEIGEIIRYTQDEVKTEDEIHNRFSEVVSSKIPAINRQISVLNVLVNVAPLLGLLGTVLGMLATFSAIAQSSGTKTIDAISAGISEALITTEMGLLIALPGFVLTAMVKRKRDEYEGFLASLESFTVLQFKHRSDLDDDDDAQTANDSAMDADSGLNPATT
ncbi:MAG TPA: MotA/TolQ/ExbB proton channel family protein [Verrucomicrobiae bacterium]